MNKILIKNDTSDYFGYVVLFVFVSIALDSHSCLSISDYEFFTGF
jgi:hypothetical protein